MKDSTSANAFKKPRPDFPLFPHATGRWAKKVRGKLKYFGKCETDPKGEAALLKWLDEKDDHIAGRTPRGKREGLTVAQLCDRFLQAKDMQLDAHEISPLTRRDYERTTDRLVSQFGKNRLVSDLASDDFEALRANISKTRGSVALGNEIQRVRVAFKYAFDAGLIDHPMRFGPMFKRPSKKALRIQKAKHEAMHGKKMFESADVQRLLDKATPQLKAMILLAVNCGFGNNDCATLPITGLDLDCGWLDFPRPKTGVQRRCPLWPETVTALREALAKRRQPKDESHAGLVFITAALGTFAKDTTDNPVTKEFAKLAKTLGLKQKGRGFYSLRHTFRTVARHAKDLEAARAIMGHESGHVEEGYEHEPIEDARLRAVTDHVRTWLWPKLAAKPKAGQAAKPAGTARKTKRERTTLRVVG